MPLTGPGTPLQPGSAWTTGRAQEEQAVSVALSWKGPGQQGDQKTWPLPLTSPGAQHVALSDASRATLQAAVLGKATLQRLSEGA